MTDQNVNNQEQELKKRSKDGKKKKKGSKEQSLLMRWGRRLLVPILCLVALMIGLYIGYAKIGGGDGSDVWNINTWKHIYDLVFAD